MGASRIDRTEDEWRNNGGKLLKRIKKQRKFYPTISKLLSDLDNKNNDPKPIVNELNSYKDELNNDWTKWVKTITQYKKDKERRKFYVDELVFNKIMCFSQESGHEENITKSLSQLLVGMNEIGINNVGDVYELMEVIDNFKDATTYKNIKSSLLTPNTNTDPTLLFVIKSIVTELKSHKIINFSELSSINTNRLKARKFEREMERNSPNVADKNKSLELLNEALKKELADKDKELAELKESIRNKKGTSINKDRSKYRNEKLSKVRT